MIRLLSEDATRDADGSFFSGNAIVVYRPGSRILDNKRASGNIKVLATAPQPSSYGIQRRYGFEYTAASWDSLPTFCEASP